MPYMITSDVNKAASPAILWGDIGSAILPPAEDEFVCYNCGDGPAVQGCAPGVHDAGNRRSDATGLAGRMNASTNNWAIKGQVSLISPPDLELANEHGEPASTNDLHPLKRLLRLAAAVETQRVVCGRGVRTGERARARPSACVRMDGGRCSPQSPPSLWDATHA
eukprot:6209824-Pleurochrysis_carterae.AAC.2